MKKSKLLTIGLVALSLSAFADSSADDMNQSAGNQQQKELSFSVYGDFLYWGTSFDYVPYYQTVDNLPNSFASIQPLNATIGWDPGFRIGLSYYDQDWRDFTTAFEWTRYYSNNSGSSEDTYPFGFLGAPEADVPAHNGTLDPFWPTVANVTSGNTWRASYTYSQKFDGFDLLFRECFKAKEFWSLTATGGLRGVLNRQKLNVYASGASNGLVVTDQPPFDTTNVYLSQQFNAIGLLGGITSTLDLGWGFSFFLGGNASLAFGKAKSSSYQVRSVINASDDDTDRSTRITYSVNRVLPMFDLSTGIEWKDTFSDNTWGINFMAAYESHLFINYPSFLYLQETFNRVTPVNTNMYFQGLTLRAGLDF